MKLIAQKGVLVSKFHHFLARILPGCKAGKLYAGELGEKVSKLVSEQKKNFGRTPKMENENE